MNNAHWITNKRGDVISVARGRQQAMRFARDCHTLDGNDFFIYRPMFVDTMTKDRREPNKETLIYPQPAGLPDRDMWNAAIDAAITTIAQMLIYEGTQANVIEQLGTLRKP